MISNTTHYWDPSEWIGRTVTYTLSKEYCEQIKMEEWKWQLKKVMEGHGHTISLLQAALIIDSLPHEYDYNKYCNRSFDECYAELDPQRP